MKCLEQLEIPAREEHTQLLGSFPSWWNTIDRNEARHVSTVPRYKNQYCPAALVKHFGNRGFQCITDCIASLCVTVVIFFMLRFLSTSFSKENWGKNIQTNDSVFVLSVLCSFVRIEGKMGGRKTFISQVRPGLVAMSFHQHQNCT